MKEQKTHLEQLTEQYKQLISEINELNNQLNVKRELSFKVLGAIEYIEQTLNNSQEQEKKQEEEEKPEEKPEEKSEEQSK